ncbi:MAG: Gfo/Idh/MocA family protein [Acidimicrobiales bacterium]
MLRVGVIGYGHWGPNYARLLETLPRVDLTAIGDRLAARQAVATERHPAVAVVGSVDEVLATAPDAVVVATPAETHLSIGLAALAAGCHVLIEKPMGLDAAEVAALVAAADDAGRTLMVDHTYLFSDGVDEVVGIVRSGALGGPFTYRSTRTNPGSVDGEVGLLRDLAVHDLSILDRVHGGLPASVSAQARADGPVGSQLVDLSLVYADGSQAEITVGWGTDHRARLVVLESVHATVVYDDLALGAKVRLLPQVSEAARRVVVHDEESDRAVDAPSADREPLRRAIEHFIRSVAAAEAPSTDGGSALRVAQVLDAGQRSIERDGRVERLDELGAHR